MASVLERTSNKCFLSSRSCLVPKSAHWPILLSTACNTRLPATPQAGRWDTFSTLLAVQAIEFGTFNAHRSICSATEPWPFPKTAVPSPCITDPTWRAVFCGHGTHSLSWEGWGRADPAFLSEALSLTRTLWSKFAKGSSILLSFVALQVSLGSNSHKSEPEWSGTVKNDGSCRSAFYNLFARSEKQRNGLHLFSVLMYLAHLWI